MSQLKLTNSQLCEIGFIKCLSKGDKMNADKSYFKIDTINGYFYYNPDEEVYKWYHKTIIRKKSNHVNLDISKKEELFILLSCFKSKFNLIF